MGNLFSKFRAGSAQLRCAQNICKLINTSCFSLLKIIGFNVSFLSLSLSNASSDERVRLMNEFIPAMRVIKMVSDRQLIDRSPCYNVIIINYNL